MPRCRLSVSNYEAISLLKGNQGHEFVKARLGCEAFRSPEGRASVGRTRVWIYRFFSKQDGMPEFGIFGGYLGDIWRRFGGCLEEFWRKFVGKLEDVKRRLEGKTLVFLQPYFSMVFGYNSVPQHPRGTRIGGNDSYQVSGAS